jgi:hypothetical protein
LKLNEVPAWFRQTPAGQQMIEQHASATVAERAAHVAAIAASQATLDKVRPKLEAAVTKAAGTVADLKEQLGAAERQFQIVQSDLLRERGAHEHRCAVAKAALRWSAPMVDQLAEDLIDLRETLNGRNGKPIQGALSPEERDRMAREALAQYRAIEDLYWLADPTDAVAEIRARFGLPQVAAAA